MSTVQDVGGFSMRAGTVPQWVDYLARLGYAAKAAIYAIVGVLAVRVAFFDGQSLEGSRGAIQTIASQPFGRVMLAVLALALLSYVGWRMIQALFDTENKGTAAQGIVTRIGFAISGLIYLSLAFWAGSIAAGVNRAGDGGGNAKQSWTAWLMSMPFGIWLVGLVGAIILGVACFVAYQSYSAKFMERYNLRELSSTARTTLKRIGQFGLAARSVTFLIIGGFLIVAAYQADPSEVKGLGGALRTLLSQPYGPWLLGVVALGMIAYAVFCAANARYRYFNVR